MRAEFDNLVQLYQQSCEQYAERPFLGTKREGRWEWTTYGQMRELIDRCRGGLHALGVGEGDGVAIVANNRVEWAVACYATYGLAGSFIPMYEQQLPKEWKFILDDCGAKVVLASTRPIFDRLVEMQPELGALEHVIGLELPEDDPRSFAALLRSGAEHPIEAREPDPETVAGLIYTSGTTGNPKGVILTHRNIASNVSAASEVFPLEPEDVTLSFLPWAHSYGQTAELHFASSQGCGVALNDAIPNLLQNLEEVKPTVLIAVPRIFNRIYDGVNRQMEERPGFLRRMFQDGIHNATRRAHGERLGPLQKLELTIDDKLIFKKVRDKFGGRLRLVISASAALNKEVAEFIDALGINVYEGYGLTETSPVVSGNTPEHRKLGSVGRAIPGVRVVIDTTASDVPGQGEIVVYGPNVMRGYHNRPEENERAFTHDGGFRTGDLGYVDEDGFLYITGRIKEQYKLENGKYVMPAPLEEELKLSPFIANVMLHGSNRPYNVALVVPDPEALGRWAAEHQVKVGDVERDPRVLELLMHEIEDRAREFKSFEVPKRALVVREDFTTENDLLTPTLKLKRRNVETRYGEMLEALYQEPLPGEERVAEVRPM